MSILRMYYQFAITIAHYDDLTEIFIKKKERIPRKLKKKLKKKANVKT